MLSSFIDAAEEYILDRTATDLSSFPLSTYPEALKIAELQLVHLWYTQRLPISYAINYTIPYTVDVLIDQWRRIG